MTAKPGRRGDGTFGELVPAAVALTEKGMLVARGPVATIEIDAETKILVKAMIKQIDRVITDLTNQATQFQSASRLSASTSLTNTSPKGVRNGQRAKDTSIRFKKRGKPSNVLERGRNLLSTSFRVCDFAPLT
jgi:hypothetical protein